MCRDTQCALYLYFICVLCLLFYAKWVIEFQQPESEVPGDLKAAVASLRKFYRENEEAVLEALGRSPCASTAPDPSDVPEAPLPAAVTEGLAQPRAPFAF